MSLCLPRILVVPLALAGLAAAVPSRAMSQEPVYTRGDANFDAGVNIADPIYVLNFLFSGGPGPKCSPIADANANGNVDISDPIAILNHLFGSLGSLPPMTEGEIEICSAPPPPTVLRCGTFGNDGPQPSHGISGCVEHMSDGTIRLSDFHYDGLGLPQVLVYLVEDWFDLETPGHVISPDLVRDTPYVGETLTYPIPQEVTADDFVFVTIFCDVFPLHFAVARLRNPPCFSPCTSSGS